MRRIQMAENETLTITVTAVDEFGAAAVIAGTVDFSTDSASLTLSPATPACAITAAVLGPSGRGTHKVVCHAQPTMPDGTTPSLTEEIEVEVLPVHGRKLLVAASAV